MPEKIVGVLLAIVAVALILTPLGFWVAAIWTENHDLQGRLALTGFVAILPCAPLAFLAALGAGELLLDDGWDGL